MSPAHFARLGAPGAEIPVLQLNGRTYDLRNIGADINARFLSTGGIRKSLAALSAGVLTELPHAAALRTGPPVAQPGKIVCIGLNYRDHAEETHADIPLEPVVFMKDPSTIVGPFDQVLIPRRSVKTDWEVELAVIIGERARYLDSPADARAKIAGYSLSNDVSEREFQLERGGQWDKGKSCETFNPLGPVLVPTAAIPDPGALGLRLWRNGTMMQNGSTAQMIFDPDYIVWYLSQYMVLNPGDIINTGTPAGVALGQPEPKPYLRAGDIIELEIDGLGRARQEMINA